MGDGKPIGVYEDFMTGFVPACRYCRRAGRRTAGQRRADGTILG
jgi:hypothetical protein